MHSWLTRMLRELVILVNLILWQVHLKLNKESAHLLCIIINSEISKISGIPYHAFLMMTSFLWWSHMRTHPGLFSPHSIQAPGQAQVGQTWTPSQPGTKPQPKAEPPSWALPPPGLLVATTRSRCIISHWVLGGLSLVSVSLCAFFPLSFLLILIHKSPKERQPPFRGEGKEIQLSEMRLFIKTQREEKRLKLFMCW